MQREIYLAGGCFWGLQHLLRRLPGVIATEVGFANGHTPHPTYEEVYTDRSLEWLSSEIEKIKPQKEVY